MTRFEVDEVERAFRAFWRTGMLCEDWNAWANLFTEDVAYHERMLGSLHGREAVRGWILSLMDKHPSIYGVYEWHSVDPSGRVVFYMQNRRDMPDGSAIDFPGITILQYAGDGMWSSEEDFWAPKLAAAAYTAHANACKQHPGHRDTKTRANWGSGPAWTIGAATWFDRPSVTA